MRTLAGAGAAQAAACGTDHGSALGSPAYGGACRAREPHLCGRQCACPCCRRASLQRQARRQPMSRRLPAPARSDLSKLGRVLGHGRRARTLSVQSRLCIAAAPAAPASSLEASCCPCCHVLQSPRPQAIECGETGLPLVCPWPHLWPDLCLRNTGKQPRNRQQDGRPCSKLLPEQKAIRK